MALDIDRELETLRQMTVAELVARYGGVFGEPPRSRHKEHLVRRIVWRMQALAEGDLSDRARQRAEELARDADLRLRPPGTRVVKVRTTTRRQPQRDRRLPQPGTVLVRAYRGQTLQVRVLADGFEYDNAIYKSLTAVALQVTGKHWNGFHFFGLLSEAAT